MDMKYKQFPLEVTPKPGFAEYWDRAKLAALVVLTAVVAAGLWYVSLQTDPEFQGVTPVIVCIIALVVFAGCLVLKIRDVRGWRKRYMERCLDWVAVTVFDLDDPHNREVFYQWEDEHPEGTAREFAVSEASSPEDPPTGCFYSPTYEESDQAPGVFRVHPGAAVRVNWHLAVLTAFGGVRDELYGRATNAADA